MWFIFGIVLLDQSHDLSLTGYSYFRKSGQPQQDNAIVSVGHSLSNVNVGGTLYSTLDCGTTSHWIPDPSNPELEANGVWAKCNPGTPRWRSVT